MKWISVKERLPDNDRLCIVFDNSDIGVCSAWFEKNYKQWDSKSKTDIISAEWVKQYEGCHDDWLLENVTHWMELPPAPTEILDQKDA